MKDTCLTFLHTRTTPRSDNNSGITSSRLGTCPFLLGRIRVGLTKMDATTNQFSAQLETSDKWLK
jgi:hypothetical protein